MTFTERVVLLAVLPALVLCGCATAGARPAAPQGAASPGERIVLVDGGAGRLRVSDGGAGEVPVVFVHGLGSDLEAWRAQLDHLRPGRRAIAYDQRGHGGSDPAHDPKGYTIDALADDLDAVVRALRVDRFYLVGHSLAGTVLTTYAAAHPGKVVGLVYADAVGDFRDVPREEIDEALRQEASPAFGKAEQRQLFSEMLAPDAKASTRERVLASLDRMDPPAFAALRRSMATFSAADRVGRYRGPRLAIEVEGRDLPMIYSALDPSAERVKLSGVSHWLMMDDPEGFDAALDRFIMAVNPSS
ncbi:MAG: alpha/beta fold hydrolase [Anaeromyxobacteraceae bacterium]